MKADERLTTLVRALLQKELEEADRVRYAFGPVADLTGLLQLDRETGDVHELKALSVPNAQSIFLRAAVEVRMLWRLGSFPAESEFDAE